jgi:hypothetical protein
VMDAPKLRLWTGGPNLPEILLYRIDPNHLSIRSLEAEWHKSCMFSPQCG